MDTGQPNSPPDFQEWGGWREQRPESPGPHLDNAAAGRSSWTVLRATSDHALLEARVGGYVAEELATPILDAGRAALAGLFGLAPGGLAFVENASAALARLLGVWPLRPADPIAIVAGEWGPNLEAFGRHGLRIVEVAAHGDGRVDLENLERLLASSPPAVVHLTQVASHRALVQPVAEAAGLCRAAGVPLWVDAAQALGHVDTATGADVVYGTSRKWLAGPRGVGVLGIAERWWEQLTLRPPALSPSGIPVGRLLEPGEAHVAGRVGLSIAVREHLDANPAAVRRRLAEVGRITRETLDDLPGWQVVDATDTPCAITALRPTAGQDLVTTRGRLIHEHGIVTTVAGVARAPREMTTPFLRVSPHVDCTPADLAALRSALAV
ncbi:MAG: ergothioneine biosynthesis PLP-dependent enzyme EgtE [Frankia sp.]